MDSIFTTIDYVRIAEEIGKRTPAPETAAEWSIFGLIIVILLVVCVASWVYFIWKERQAQADDQRINATLLTVNETMQKLVIYFDQNNIRDDVQAIKTDIAIIKEKLKP